MWVPDTSEAWAKAVVTKVDSDGLLVTVEETDELRKVKADDAPLQNLDSRGVEVREWWWLDGVGVVGTEAVSLMSWGVCGPCPDLA